MRTFKVTEEHLLLVENLLVRWDSSCFGAPSIDSKRPYGNSDVIDDIFEILKWEIDGETPDEDPKCDKAHSLHKDMKIVLQILIDNRSIQKGLYYIDEVYIDKGWKLKET